MRRLLYPALCCMLLVSCAPRPVSVVLDTDVTPASTLAALVKERSAKLKSLVGRGTISFDSPEMSGTAAFRSSIKKPDSMLVSLTGPFGIGVGTFFLSREHYVLYSSLENRVITGTPDARSIRSIIPFEMTYDQILDAFSGLFALPVEIGVPLRYEVVEGRFLLSYQCGIHRCTYWIDPSYLLVTRFEQRDEDGGLVVEAVCSSLTEDDGAVVPKRISVKFPGEDRGLSITYSSLTINGPDPSFAFSIPKNAQTIIR